MPEFHTDYQQYMYTAVSSELLHSFIQLVTNCHQSLINLKRKEYRPNGGHDYAGKDVATQKQIHSDVTHYRLNFRKFVGHRVEADLEDLTYLEISDIQRKRVPKIVQAGY